MYFQYSKFFAVKQWGPLQDILASRICGFLLWFSSLASSLQSFSYRGKKWVPRKGKKKILIELGKKWLSQVTKDLGANEVPLPAGGEPQMSTKPAITQFPGQCWEIGSKTCLVNFACTQVSLHVPSCLHPPLLSLDLHIRRWHTE